MSAIHMRIVQGHDLIADLPEWEGPIPRVGDYILHPPFRPGGDEGIAGCVALVKWRTHDRSDPDATEFVQTIHPYVEIALAL
jgi:hypothetical protein